MWHDSVFNTVQEPTVTSIIVAKKTTTWGESGFPSEFLGQELAPLCQEGMQLVRNPLPVWPHVKVIQSHKEGMEVANLLGNGSAVLLFGHGAVTAGGSLPESVTAMAELEEQARMNYLALCALEVWPESHWPGFALRQTDVL